MEHSVHQQAFLIGNLLPLLLVSAIFGLISYKLAKDKGRNVTLWTILGLIPIVNMFAMWFFVGATNLRLEEKIDKLLEKLEKNQ